MNSLSRIIYAAHPALLACCLVAVSSGCRKDQPVSAVPTSTNESFEQQESRLDRTVWKDEIVALQHEKTFVRLRDDLRAATNKIQALARLQFQEMIVPRPETNAQVLGLGIGLQKFDDQQRARLTPADWQKTLERLSNSGWRVAQGEWTHEHFQPATKNQPARSRMKFELHGERLAARTRFILRADCLVDWDPAPAGSDLIHPQRLVFSNVQVLERTGPPGFNLAAAIIPEVSDQKGTTIDLHPLIVTDLNQDGNEDIILPEVNKMFLNDGTARFSPGPFIQENLFVGANKAGVAADFNGDGKVDFLTVGLQREFTNQLVLYPGNGELPFSEKPITAWPGRRIIGPSVITAGDIDHDGDLDIWVAQYKPPYIGGQVPTPYYDSNDGYPSVLLINDGRGRFEDATDKNGLGAKRNRRTFSASLADLTGDGHPDLLTVNDFSGMDLFENDGKGRFTDITSRLSHRHLFGMAHALADFDRDGRLDIFGIGMSVTTVRRLESMKLGRSDLPDRNQKRGEMTYGNRLLLSRTIRWVQADFADKLAMTGWSWGTSASDFDNDGDLDVYVANGFISGESTEDYCSHCWRHDMYLGNSGDDPRLLAYFSKGLHSVNSGKTSWNGHQADVLFLDFGTNHYVNVAYLMGVAHETDCRAVVGADLNNDGRRDLVITERQWFVGPSLGRHRVLVYLNQLETKNRWIGVKLESSNAKSSSIGAVVQARAGQRNFVHQMVTGDSFQSQHPNTVHFGLGSEMQVAELEIRWPNGKTNLLKNPALNQYHRVKLQ